MSEFEELKKSYNERSKRLQVMYQVISQMFGDYTLYVIERQVSFEIELMEKLEKADKERECQNESK